MYTLDEAPEPTPPARRVGGGSAWIIGADGLDVPCVGRTPAGAVDALVAKGPPVTLTAPGGFSLRIGGEDLSGRWGERALAPVPLARQGWWHVTVSFDAGELAVFVDGLPVATLDGGPEAIDLGALRFVGDGAAVDEVAVFTAPILAAEALTLELVHRGRRPVPGARDLPVSFVLDQSPGALTGAAYGPGDRLAATWIGAQLSLWDTASGALLRALPGDAPIERAAFSPDGAILAVMTTDGTRVHEVATGDLLHRQPRVSGAATPPVGAPPVVSPNGDLIALANRAQTILWNARSGELVHTFEDRDEGGDAVAFDATGQAVFRVERDRVLQRWSSSTPTLTRSRAFGGKWDRIHALTRAPSGRLLVWTRDEVHTIDPVTLESSHVTPAPRASTPGTLGRLGKDLVWARHADEAVVWREGADGALSTVFTGAAAVWLPGQLSGSIWKVTATGDRFSARLIEAATGNTLDRTTWVGVEAWPESLVLARTNDSHMLLEAGTDHPIFTSPNLPTDEAIAFHPTRGIGRVRLERDRNRRLWPGAGVVHEAEITSREARLETSALRDPMYVPQLEFSAMGTELLVGTASHVRVVDAWTGEASFEADVRGGGHDLGRPGGVDLAWNSEGVFAFEVDTGEPVGEVDGLGHVMAVARAADARSIWIARLPEGFVGPRVIERRALPSLHRVLESHDLPDARGPLDASRLSDDGTLLFVMSGQTASLWSLEPTPKTLWTAPVPDELGFDPTGLSLIDDLWIDAHGVRLGVTSLTTMDRTTAWLAPEDGALLHLERGHGLRFVDEAYRPGRLGRRCVEGGHVFERVAFEGNRLRVLGRYPTSDTPPRPDVTLTDGCATQWAFSKRGSAVGIYTQRDPSFSMTLRYTAPDGATRRLGRLGEPRSAAVASMGGEVVSTVHVTDGCIEHFMPRGRVARNCGAASPLGRLVAIPGGGGFLSDGGPQGAWLRWRPGHAPEPLAIPTATGAVAPTDDPDAFVLVSAHEVALWNTREGVVWRARVPQQRPVVAVDGGRARVYVGGLTDDPATSPTRGLALATGEVVWEGTEGEALVSIDVHEDGGDWAAVNHRGELLWYGADGAITRRVLGPRGVAGMEALAGYRAWIEQTPGGRRVYLSMATSARLRAYDHATGQRLPDLSLPTHGLYMLSKDVGVSASMVWRRHGDAGGLAATLLYRGVGRAPLLVEWDEEGHFAAQGELPEDPPVYGVRGLERVGLAQLARRRNRPDLLYARDPEHDPRRVAHYRALHERRVAGLPEPTGRPPRVRIRAVEDLGARVKVRVDARADAGLGEVTLRAQGVVVGRRRLGGARRAQVTFEVDKTNGVNVLEAQSFDAARVASATAEARVDAPPPLPSRTYYLGIGVSSYDDPSIADLRYADDDARDVLDALRRRDPEVIGRVLVDDEVTPANLDAARAWLARANPQDNVVILVSGHGMYTRGAVPTYTFLTPGTQVDRLEQTALSFEAIEALVAATPARQRLVLLDTCQSGALAPGALAAPPSLPESMHAKSFTVSTIDAPPPRPWLHESRLVQRDLDRDLGAVVIASSRGFESSWERDDFANGAFTEAIVEALSGAADLDGDGDVDARELLRHVMLRVPAWTGGLQNPTVDRDNPRARIAL
jgi:hypothetical protein